jgi:hypothetical protein
MTNSLEKLLLAAASFCAACVLASTVGAQRQPSSQAQSVQHRMAHVAQRLRPPAGLKCDDNHLTSFTGKILYYQRRPGRISLRMRTDEATTESFTLRFPKTADASKWFLINSQPFQESDWTLVERARSRLRPGMRATVWVCDDGSTPIVDWRPGERDSKAVY